MNGSYYQNPTFPNAINNYQESLPEEPVEQSYIENILRLNKGKEVKAFVSFPDSSAWQNKIFDGIIEEAGKDHLIISNPTDGDWFLIPLIYVNYVEFMEKINYSHAYSEKTF